MIAVVPVEKLSLLKLHVLMSQSVQISRIEEQKNGSSLVSLECP